MKTGAISFTTAFDSIRIRLFRFCNFFHLPYILLLSAFFISSATAQDTLKTGDALQPAIKSKKVNINPLAWQKNVTEYPYNKTRVKIVAAGSIAGYGAVMAGLYSAWYKDYAQSGLHAFNDLSEWKQVDKIGHVYSAYIESKLSMEMWRWTGISRKKRIWLGGLSGAVYQTVIETLDGFSSQWGWSWGDFGANVIGSGMFIAQELAWDDQLIQMKWSFYSKHYSDPTLQKRSGEIFGKSTLERLLKDYNGQTYWLSVNLKNLLPKSRIPAWLQVSLGTGAEGLFGANENTGTDKFGNVIFNRPDIKRYRQWYLAPDIDLTRIKTRKKGIRFALTALNVIKFPAPSLEFSNGSFKWHWIHF